MKIDIEKLNRKTPYPEPSEDFFEQVQANVISQTVGKNPMSVKKDTKVFALDFKWMAAAAVLLIGGITTFVGFNNDPEISLAQQAPIVDSAYETEHISEQSSQELVAVNKKDAELPAQVAEENDLKNIAQTPLARSERKISADKGVESKNYNAKSNNTAPMDVEKVLAAFTPDQLKDIDRNSEQDVYLDLYN